MFTNLAMAVVAMIAALVVSSQKRASDTAIWLTNERVIFTAASVGVKSVNYLRPFVRSPIGWTPSK